VIVTLRTFWEEDGAFSVSVALGDLQDQIGLGDVRGPVRAAVQMPQDAPGLQLSDRPFGRAVQPGVSLAGLLEDLGRAAPFARGKAPAGPRLCNPCRRAPVVLRAYGYPRPGRPSGGACCRAVFPTPASDDRAAWQWPAGSPRGGVVLASVEGSVDRGESATSTGICSPRARAAQAHVPVRGRGGWLIHRFLRISPHGRGLHPAPTWA